MNIKLSKKQKEIFFYNSLCNGLSYFNSYGLEITYNQKDYIKAKKQLKENPKLLEAWGGGGEICYEDVIIQILKGGSGLKIQDNEDEGEEWGGEIFLKDLYVNIEFTPQQYLKDMLEENDDAITSDCIIQSVFFKDIIFG